MNKKNHTKNRRNLYLIDDIYSYKPINYEGHAFYASYIPSFIIGTVIIYTIFYGVVYTGILAITYIS